MSTLMFRPPGTYKLLLSEAIDSNQSVVLQHRKVTIDTDRWKSVTETSTDTDNDHMSSNCDIKSSFGMCYILQRIIMLLWSCCVNCIDYGRGGRNSLKTVL